MTLKQKRGGKITPNGNANKKQVERPLYTKDSSEELREDTAKKSQTIAKLVSLPVWFTVAVLMVALHNTKKTR